MVEVDVVTIYPDIEGIPRTGGIVCTYGTKKIRSMVEDLLEVNYIITLPKKYTYKIMPSAFWGKVAKIVKRKK